MNLFLVYQFLKRLAKPFKKWEAYDLGIIDEKGNILKSRKSLTKMREKQAFGVYDLMILNMKKLLAKVPGGSSPIASYAAALYLLKEWNHFTEDSLLTEEVSDKEVMESVESFKPYLSFCLDKSIIPQPENSVNQIMNEEPTNSAGSGAIAGIGVGPDGEPGLTPAQRIKYIAKNKHKKKEKKNAEV